MTKYTTNFTKGYCDHWTISQAISEFVSNFLDSEGEQEFEFTEDSITLTNKNIIVSNKLILSGCTDKKLDETQRGFYGQGSMQALCVLTALDINVSIHNGDIVWDARFEDHPQIDEKVLVVDETSAYKSNNFSVHISGLQEEDIEEVLVRCLVFQDREVLHSTEIGDIIGGGEGELYVGSMFVTENSDFKYSYNFNPSVVPLTSDRNCMDPWEVKKLTAKLISMIDDETFVKDAIDANKEDTRLVCDRYYTEKWSGQTSVAVDSFGEEFVEEHKGKVVTSNYSEHRENEELGNPSVYEQNAVKVKAIKESAIYQESIEDIEIVEKATPYEVMENLNEHLIQYLDNKLSAEDLTEVESMLKLVVDRSSEWSGDSASGLPF